MFVWLCWELAKASWLRLKAGSGRSAYGFEGCDEDPVMAWCIRQSDSRSQSVRISGRFDEVKSGLQWVS